MHVVITGIIKLFNKNNGTGQRVKIAPVTRANHTKRIFCHGRHFAILTNATVRSEQNGR